MKSIHISCGLFVFAAVFSALGTPVSNAPSIVNKPDGTVTISVPLTVEGSPFVVYTRITTSTRRMVNTAEGLGVRDRIYQRILTLHPGAYRLTAVTIDKTGKRVRFEDVPFNVPKDE
jgi:hypothetical protein